MDNPKEDLFDGIEIMSPGELDSAISTGEETTESEEKIESTDDISIVPVEQTSGDLGETAEEGKIVEPEETTKTTSTSQGPSESDKSAFYTAMLKEMINEGVIASPETEEELEGSLDKLKELMKGTLEKSFQGMTKQWQDGFSGAKKKFLEIEGSFTDADLAVQTAQQLEFFDNLSEKDLKEDDTLQKNVYYEYLKSKNFSDAEIREQIEDADAIGKLEDKALKAVPYLRQRAAGIIKQEDQKKQAEEAQWTKRREENYNHLMSSIDKKDEFIDGLKLNKVSKEKLKANITQPIYTDDKGKGYTSLMYKQMRNPTSFEMLVNYYDSIGLFDIDKGGNFKPNISKLQKIAKTRAVSELDKVIAASNERGVGRQTSVDASEKTTGILDLLERGIGKKTRRK
ncbi:MAG: hypothetical protein V3V41_01680 [Candidatus Heimdallarchaeota archaeon]